MASPRRQVKRENDGLCADDYAVAPLVVKEDAEDLEAAEAATRNALVSPEQCHTPALRELNSEVFCSYDPQKLLHGVWPVCG
jgi:hypothetical protein